MNCQNLIDFFTLEQAEVIKRLLNFGWKVTEVVKKTGRATGYIENLILLSKISAHAVIQIMQAVKGDADKGLNQFICIQHSLKRLPLRKAIK